MEGSSNQSGSSSSKKLNTAYQSNSIASKKSMHKNIFNHHILFKLEEDGFTTPDDKAKELIKELTEIKYLYALKLLFENPLYQFSPQVLRDSLVALADPTPFDYYAKQSVTRLELHLRTWVAVLEQICVTPMRLSKNLRDKVYNSLPEFAEIHGKTTQVMQEGIDNKYRSDFNQFNQLQANKEDEDTIKKRNYNIDFLLIHLRDTLHSFRDDETWFQEILRRTKELLSAALNITPLAASGVTPNNTSSILSILTQLRQGLSFKYPVASTYVDWRIMLIIQNNLFKWSESHDISKKLEEMVLMEYLWSYLEREWNDVADKSILDSQSKFDEVSNKLVKILRNAGSFLNDLSGNEPITLPHTLWFGILDLAQNFIQKSTRKATYGLCYYLATESLNKAPSSFIQFKAIEVLLHLCHIDEQMFSLIEIDFDQYTHKLDENSSENFQNLLSFIKEKCLEDFNILNGDIGNEKRKGKGKSLSENTYLKRDQTSNSCNILDIIADEMTCPIDSEPTDQLCILKCQHILSSVNLKKLKQKKCPECREEIDDNDIRYLSQNTIYKSLYSKFFEAGHILPSIELENSDQTTNNQYNSDSDNSEENLILSKKKKFIKAIKLNSDISLQSIFQSKKQHLIQSVMKALDENNYEKAEYLCKEFLRKFPKSYSARCILAYIYRCLNNYEQALLYLNKAISLKRKNPIAWYIYGEINFRQSNYDSAIDNLDYSIYYKNIINNLNILLGNCYLLENNYYESVVHYNSALENDPYNYLCLKNCAYCYEKRSEYTNTLQMLDILLSINRKDSLILCYYGEILNSMKRYNDAISYFTEASIIDPENSHILIKRAISYYLIQKYEEALLDFNKSIKLDPNNVLVKIYIYHLTYLLDNKDNNSSMDLNDIIELMAKITNNDNDELLLSVRCRVYIELNEYSKAKLVFDILFELKDDDISFVYLLRKYSNFWSYLCGVHKLDGNDFTELGLVNKFNIYMFKVKNVYLISNLINLDGKLCQFQASNSNSLSGQVLSYKGEELNLCLPKFPYTHSRKCAIIWKINVKKILSEDCFIKFVTKRGEINSDIIHYDECILKYEDVLKLKGLGWIEYRVEYKSLHPYDVVDPMWVQFSIEANKNFIHMQIDYVRFIESNYRDFYLKQIHFYKMGHSLSFRINYPNVPETFKDIYFSRKEMENLLELKDIINNL